LPHRPDRFGGSRHVTRSRAVRRCSLVLALLLGAGSVALAQDSRRSTPRRPPPTRWFAPSVPWGLLAPVPAAGVGPGAARSQADRGIFVAWGRHPRHEPQDPPQLAYLRRNDSSAPRTSDASTRTGIVLLAFNHLFAGLEAYVSAHLADFPDDLRFQAVPGGVAATMSVPFRLR
jgi:hypothetical protein